MTQPTRKTIGEIMNMKFDESPFKVVLEEGEIVIYGPGVETGIDLGEAQTTRGLCEWIIYLCQRTWITPEIIEAVVRLWMQANDIDPPL